MTIDRLSSLTAQLAALRAELAKKSAGAPRTRTHDAAGDARAQRHSPDKGALRSQLSDIVKSVSLEADGARDALRRRIVGAVLQWEFGADLREHPEWQPMIETITRTMADDPRTAAAIDSLINDLAR